MKLKLNGTPPPKKYAHLALGKHYDELNRMYANVTPEYWELYTYGWGYSGDTNTITITSSFPGLGVTTLYDTSGKVPAHQTRISDGAIEMHAGKIGVGQRGLVSRASMRTAVTASYPLGADAYTLRGVEWDYKFFDDQTVLSFASYNARGSMAKIETLFDCGDAIQRRETFIAYNDREQETDWIVFDVAHPDKPCISHNKTTYDELGRVVEEYRWSRGMADGGTHGNLSEYTYKGGACAPTGKTIKIVPVRPLPVYPDTTARLITRKGH
jgi:hypothetical protein